VQKLKKDLELITIQYETSEASLKKRHQEAINDLSDQLEQLNRQRNKSVQDPARHGASRRRSAMQCIWNISV